MRSFCKAGGALVALALAALTPAARGADAAPPARVALGTPGWLGVAMDARADAGSGVRVRHVVRGSPAEKAGLRTGDVIAKIDDAAVTSAAEVTRLVGAKAPGDVVVALVARGSESARAVRITLAERPSSDDMLRMDRVGAFAPAWQGLEPLGAAPRSLEALRGRVVLVDFWATWCGACRVLAPTLSGWQARYGAQGLTVVGVTTEPAEQAALFAERTGMRYALASDPSGETTSAYSVSALPTLFVIDKRGVVRDVAIGFDPRREAEVERLVKTLLAEPAPGTSGN